MYFREMARKAWEDNRTKTEWKEKASLTDRKVKLDDYGLYYKQKQIFDILKKAFYNFQKKKWDYFSDIWVVKNILKKTQKVYCIRKFRWLWLYKNESSYF